MSEGLRLTIATPAALLVDTDDVRADGVDSGRSWVVGSDGPGEAPVAGPPPYDQRVYEGLHLVRPGGGRIELHVTFVLSQDETGAVSAAVSDADTACE